MAKDCHQLMRSSQRGLCIAVVVLAASAGTNRLLAGGGEPPVAHHHAHGVGTGAIEYDGRAYHDNSCEPTFQGGNCEDCCLNLWQNYCADRQDCHCHALSPGHRGLGFLGLIDRLALHGRAGCGHGCETCSAGGGCNSCNSGSHDASHGHVSVPPHGKSSIVHGQAQPKVAPATSDAHAYSELQSTGAVDANAVPAAPVPPRNPLPPTPDALDTDTTPASRGDYDTAPAVAPPVPSEIDFSVEPPSPRRARITTVSLKNGGGTARLLQQLKAN